MFDFFAKKRVDKSTYYEQIIRSIEMVSTTATVWTVIATRVSLEVYRAAE